MPLHVAFLWHMHQPDYVDASTRTALLPWVRLHACKGYLDMVAMAEKFPSLRLTFNITPVLIRQIEEQADGKVRDLWAEWAAIPANSLDRTVKLKILRHFFPASPHTMISPYPRYAELWRRRGLSFHHELSDAALSGWGESDWRDLQVWQNLAWFGYTASALYPEIEELKKKGRDFTEADKQIVLRRQQDILKNLLARYKRLSDDHRIELTTTPFYHPIVPLLIDTEIARRCMPQAALPTRLAFPEDAREHLSRAIAYSEKTFGQRPRGIWPAEGAVCPEMLPMLAEQRIEWFATDQEILFRSLKEAEGRPVVLWRPYECETENGKIHAIFRDRNLSDFIGFVASRNPASLAVASFFDQLQQIREQSQTAGLSEPLVAVILDGENAWNYFADSGQSFLEQLYAGLTSKAGIVTSTVSDYLTAYPSQGRLKRIYSGSWINADFDTWIGGEEENRAWDLLGQTRRLWQKKVSTGHLSTEQITVALESLYAAEGSDWFWWYGPDFESDEKFVLDELFRSHLQQVYRTLKTRVPAALCEPICHAQIAREMQLPRNYIHPIIDGRVTSFYEWQEAGKFVVGSFEKSTMAGTEHRISAIYFGFSRDRLFLRVDPTPAGLVHPGISLSFHFFEPRKVILRLAEIRKNQPMELEILTAQGTADLVQKTQLGSLAMATDIIELGVPFETMGFSCDSEVKFTLQVLENGLETESYPDFGYIQFRLPGANFPEQSWTL